MILSNFSSIYQNINVKSGSPGLINLFFHWTILCFSADWVISTTVLFFLNNYISDCVFTIFSLFLSACKTLLNKKSDGVKVSSLTHEDFIDFTVFVLLTVPVFCLFPLPVSFLVWHPNYSLLTCIFDIVSIWKALCSFSWITFLLWCSFVSLFKVY